MIATGFESNPTRSAMPIIPGKGVNEMAIQPTERVGVVTISTLKDGRSFQLRWGIPTDTKKVVRGLTRKEVRDLATQINEEACRQFHGGQMPTIHDSIAKAIRLSRQRDYVRVESARQGKKFEEWLLVNHLEIDPRTSDFTEVPTSVLKEYVRELEIEGQSWESVNKRLKPIRSAWNLIVEDYPNQLRPWPKKLQEKKPRRKVDCLDASEVKVLLDWRKTHQRSLWRITVCMAVAGLRPSEIRSLRRQDVDPAKLLVAITETDSHDPKSENSERIDPVCSEVMDSILEEMEEQKVIPVTGEIFLNPETNTPWTKTALEKHWRKEIRQKIADETKCPRIAQFTQYSLRRSFTTMADQLNVPDRIIKAYIGHAPDPHDVMGGHYRAISVDELRLVSSAMEDWRTLIDKLEEWKNSGRSK